MSKRKKKNKRKTKLWAWVPTSFSGGGTPVEDADAADGKRNHILS